MNIFIYYSLGCYLPIALSVGAKKAHKTTAMHQPDKYHKALLTRVR